MIMRRLGVVMARARALAQGGETLFGTAPPGAEPGAGRAAAAGPAAGKTVSRNRVVTRTRSPVTSASLNGTFEPVSRGRAAARAAAARRDLTHSSTRFAVIRRTSTAETLPSARTCFRSAGTAPG